MIKNRLLILLVVAVASGSARAQNAGDKPLTESELLKQIETLNPTKGATPVPRPDATANPLFSPATTTGNILKPGPTKIGSGIAGPDDSGKPGKKAPTEITALEATFDQKANVAVFVGSVIVKDPQFNVTCDKLTAFLQHDDKSAPNAATPNGAIPKPATPAPNGAPATKKGGLEKAIAVTTSDRRVVITQDKVESDGSITHGIGIADRAEYFATTGDIFLYGTPDVTQGVNRCIATAPETVMTLNRDGHMTAKGPHRTFITAGDDSRDSGKGNSQ